MSERSITVNADDSQLDCINSFIEQALEPLDCPMKAMLQTQLAVEEIFVNIAHYAYAPGSGEAEITVSYDESGSWFSIEFKDRGVPFNPLDRDEADVSLSADERDIGGLGILLVKKNMDDVSYSRENGANILKIVKKI